jgi:hypothetical protein
MEVFIIKADEMEINFGNKITRLYYVIRVNKVLISPAELNSAPIPDIMKLYIEGLSKNFNEKFILCGMMIDINKNVSFLSNIKQDFYIVTNINPKFDSLAQSNIIKSVKQAMLKTTDSLLDGFQFKLMTDSQNMFVLNTENWNFDDTVQFKPVMYVRLTILVINY